MRRVRLLITTETQKGHHYLCCTNGCSRIARNPTFEKNALPNRFGDMSMCTNRAPTKTVAIERHPLSHKLKWSRMPSSSRKMRTKRWLTPARELASSTNQMMGSTPTRPIRLVFYQPLGLIFDLHYFCQRILLEGESAYSARFATNAR